MCVRVLGPLHLKLILLNNRQPWYCTIEAAWTKPQACLGRVIHTKVDWGMARMAGMGGLSSVIDFLLRWRGDE